MQNARSLYVPAMAPVYEKVQGYAYPVLRICAGLFLMPHGAQKLLGWFGGFGPDGGSAPTDR